MQFHHLGVTEISVACENGFRNLLQNILCFLFTFKKHVFSTQENYCITDDIGQDLFNLNCNFSKVCRYGSRNERCRNTPNLVIKQTAI